jgi:hypothetical protein
MKSNEVLQKAEASVAAVEAKLEAHDQQAGLTAAIEELKKDEQFILAGDDRNRVKKLLEARAKLDVVEADSNKLKAEISAAQDEAIEAAISCHQVLCQARDEIIAARREQVKSELGKLFPRNVIDLMNSFIGYSTPVRNVWSEHFTFLRDKPGKALALARKLRPLFQHLQNPEQLAVEALAAAERAEFIQVTAGAGKRQFARGNLA